MELYDVMRSSTRGYVSTASISRSRRCASSRLAVPRGSRGSTLTLNNGTILAASGGSVVTIKGGLVNFGGVGNTINITNNLCPGGCTVIGGLKVLLTNGAIAGNVSVNTPIINPGGGTINFSNGGNTAHITVDGATTHVRIGG